MLDNLKKLLSEYRTIVFFDTETTGLDPVNDRIIELACVKVKLKQFDEIDIEKFDYFIEPDDKRPVPEKITELTHITNYDVYEGDNHISEQQAAHLFEVYINMPKTLLVAHNAQFDLNFVKNLLLRNDERVALHLLDEADYLDSLTVFKDRAKFPHKLVNAIEHYGLEDQVKNSHRAVDDTLALAYVVNAMFKERNDLLAYVNVFGYNEKYGVNGERFSKITYSPQSYGYYIKPKNKILPYTLQMQLV